MAITVSQLNRYIKDKIADDENLENIFLKIRKTLKNKAKKLIDKLIY